MIAMGRKAFIAATIKSLVLISLIVGMQTVEIAEANPTQTPIFNSQSVNFVSSK